MATNPIEIDAQRFEAAPFGQPDLTVVVELEPSPTGKTWRVRWFRAGMDRGVSANNQFYERAEASCAPNAFEVFESHRGTLGNNAEISGNRGSGSALHLTQGAALEIAGAARATYADALVRPFERFSFGRAFE